MKPRRNAKQMAVLTSEISNLLWAHDHSEGASSDDSPDVLMLLLTWWLNGQTDTTVQSLDFFRQKVAPKIEAMIRSGVGRI